ncbi:MAG: selenocysteine-specific translation elongation factor, partial [bacterium]
MTTHGRRILGTAGHIDHGKTELIHAITGQETDRLEEEKRRGISIELGFAHHEIDGTRFGVIDVPGHERFLHHMLAGAQGIDLVLLVVAADDGVMPQTEEHFDILHLLGVERMLVVITKSDLVLPARLDEVREEVAILTAGSNFESATVCAVSAREGAGIEELRADIARELAALPPRPVRGPFRMPIDRSFVLHGHGVVVTGTASSGEVKVGDTLFLRPGGKEVRARTVQLHGEPVDQAAAGQRVALNLPGLETEEAPRGSWITARGVYATTDRFDCDLEVRPGAARPLRSFDRIRLHIGTSEVHGKLIFLGDKDEVAPKQRAFCQIVLDEEILAGHGDRFVIRLETASRTAGGGRVLHPFAKRHKTHESRVTERLTQLAGGRGCDLVVPFLDLHTGFAAPMKLVAQGLLLTEDELCEEIPDLEG